MKLQKGIAHLVVIVGLVVALGAVSFAGIRVLNYTENDSASDETAAELAGEIKVVEINSAGTAANASGDIDPDQPINPDEGGEAVRVETSYDITTAYGSLKYVEGELKAGRFSNVLNFITPRMYFQISDNLDTDRDYSAIKTACSSNQICDLAVESTSFGSNYRTENYDYPYASVDGKKLIYKLSDVNALGARYYGDLDITIYMLDINTNWVIDKVQVGDYTL